MKRPLCLLAILLSAAVCIYLEVFLSDIIGNMNAAPDGSYQTVIGRVQSKEVRRSYQGEFIPVIYIVPTEQTNKHSKLIQCYLESGDEALPAIGEYIQVSGNLDSRINMTRLAMPLRESCKYLPACPEAHQS